MRRPERPIPLLLTRRRDRSAFAQGQWACGISRNLLTGQKKKQRRLKPPSGGEPLLFFREGLRIRRAMSHESPGGVWADDTVTSWVRTVNALRAGTPCTNIQLYWSEYTTRSPRRTENDEVPWTVNTEAMICVKCDPIWKYNSFARSACSVNCDSVEKCYIDSFVTCCGCGDCLRTDWLLNFDWCICTHATCLSCSRHQLGNEEPRCVHCVGIRTYMRGVFHTTVLEYGEWTETPEYILQASVSTGRFRWRRQLVM